jgi:hypothetical protein
MPATKIIRRFDGRRACAHDEIPTGEIGDHPGRAGAAVLPRVRVKALHLRDEVSAHQVSFRRVNRRHQILSRAGFRVIAQSGEI